jgi:hypothetical protein
MHPEKYCRQARNHREALAMQMDWSFIKEVTDVDQTGYQELRRQLAQLREHNESIMRQPTSN